MDLGPSTATLSPDRAVPEAPPLVSLRDVEKRYGNGTLALTGMSMDIRQGEFVSLLGPSGCGKSTALRLIAGLGQPSDGRLSTPRTGNRKDQSIGFVFQEPTLMPWADVFDNVWLPLRLAGQSRHAARDQVREALRMVGLEKFARSYPRELSGGMKMRVSIARALVTQPKLLLMDEPFAALDEITRQKLNDDILRLWEKFGWTVIFVTHSVFEATYLSSRVVVMAPRPGRVVSDRQLDLPYPRGEEFRTDPRFAAVARELSAALHDTMQPDPEEVR